jgi:hypothetical protein
VEVWEACWGKEAARLVGGLAERNAGGDVDKMADSAHDAYMPDGRVVEQVCRQVVRLTGQWVQECIANSFGKHVTLKAAPQLAARGQ